ncbi:MAG: hemolysin III family protein [Candidatus Hydrogenedentes bacterium]|nr:hemolysin III family protein [Candidatus Hydrogenedentota bacterium]
MHTVDLHLHRKKQAVREEVANSVTHGIGTALSIAGLVFLVVWASATHDAYKIVSLTAFGASMVALYLASTLYHSFSAPKVKHFFRILDHASIYLLIAGSYTPFALVSIRGPWGWTIFGVVWGIALVGVCFKMFFVAHFSALSTILYLGMGWMALIAAKPILMSVPMGGIGLLAAGGIMYTVGVAFYAWNSLPYNHAVWHLFVMAGTAFHFIAVSEFVLPA